MNEIMLRAESTPAAALSVALSYFRAWTTRDLERTMRHVAADVVCDAPGGRVEGVAAFRKFWAGFLDMLTGARLVAAYGNERTAVLLYSADTIPVDNAFAAEYLTVENGVITASRLVFDRMPFADFRGGARARLEAAQSLNYRA